MYTLWLYTKYGVWLLMLLCLQNAAVGAYEYLCWREAAKNGDTPGDISRLFGRLMPYLIIVCPQSCLADHSELFWYLLLFT